MAMTHGHKRYSKGICGEKNIENYCSKQPWDIPASRWCLGKGLNGREAEKHSGLPWGVEDILHPQQALFSSTPFDNSNTMKRKGNCKCILTALGKKTLIGRGCLF